MSSGKPTTKIVEISSWEDGWVALLAWLAWDTAGAETLAGKCGPYGV